MSNLEKNLKIANYLLQFAEDIMYQPGFLDNLKRIVQNEAENKKLIINVDEDVKSFKQFFQTEIEKLPINKQIVQISQPGIEKAKLYCHTLVVGVVNDEQIRLRKGPNILDIEERLELVKCCKWADEVYAVDKYDPDFELLDKLNCSHCAHGDDIILRPNGQDCYYEFKQAGRMITFKRTEGISTTDIVGRLLQMTNEHLITHTDERKMMRKMSEDENSLGIQASQIDIKLQKNLSSQQESISSDSQSNETYISQLPKVKLLNTTRRIRQFSSGREITPDDKVVYIDGGFDILHLGHLKILEAAKKLGTFLLVGLHDDDILHEKQGQNYPVLNVQERTLNLLANKNVDEVIIGAPWKITENLIKSFNISMVVSGSFSKLQNKIENETEDPYEIPKKMNIFKQIQSYPRSIVDIIQRIIDNRLFYITAQKKKEQKLLEYYQNQNFEVKEAFDAKQQNNV